VVLNGKIKLMNMKENIISKIKLMMSYDMGKTLIENKEINNLLEDEDEDINEINPAAADDALATLKNLGKGGKTSKAIAQDIVATMSKGGKEGEAIHIIGKNNNLVPVTTGDELLVALKAGTIDAVNLGRVNKGILKSGAVTDVNLLRNIASDVVVEANFINKYGKEYVKSGESGARKLLQDNGYTRNAIDEIIAKMNKIPNYGKDVTSLKKGLTKAKATNKTQKATIKSQGERIKELEDFKANSANMTKGEATTTIGTQINYGTVTKESAAETNAAVNGAKNIAPEVKATANEASTVVKEMKPSRWERWKAWAKKNPKSSKALIFLGLSLTGWALYKMFSSNDRKDEVKKTLFANCAGDLLDTENSKILTMEDGSPVIGVSPTGNKEYDSKKGLKFFSNNRVLSGDNTMRGTWGCKGGTIGVQSEQTGLPGTDLGLNVLSRIAQNREINKAQSVGNVLNKINITWDTKSTGGGGGGKDNDGGGGGTKNTIPIELKDVEGVKKFQTWLDSKHAGWHTKYGTLNDNTLKGWGKYGPNTTRAWSQYKDEYLNGSTASGTETPIPSTGVDVTKPSGIPGSPDMVGKSGLNLDVNRIKVTKQDVNNEIDKKIQPSNTELTDREKEILSNVKSRGADKVYKGGTLTPEEQQWLSKYYGGVIKKIKNEKGYGQKTVIDVPKKDTTSNEPLNEENIIKKIVSKNLKSLIK
jgi:hypothetical protein